MKIVERIVKSSLQKRNQTKKKYIQSHKSHKMDNKHKLPIGCSSKQSTTFSLALLFVVTLNLQPVECKSMPIDQQMLPSLLPMIFLGKSSYQQQQPHSQINHHNHHNQYNQQIHQQPQQQPQQQHYQRPHDARQVVAPVALVSNATDEPMAAKSSTAASIFTNPADNHHQKMAAARAHLLSSSSAPDMIQTSASYVNEISAKQVRRRPAALPDARSASAADADENDADSDESDDELPATNQKSSVDGTMGGPQADLEDQPIEPTRRQAGGRQFEALGGRASVEAVTKLRYNGPALNVADNPEGPDAEAASRKEQENAEASEAEVADRSALDEQRQAQREIILAQAQSEAKAIKEQQEALLKQQALQQQMIMRRQDLDFRNRTSNLLMPQSSHGELSNRHGGGSSSKPKRGQRQQQLVVDNQYDDDEQPNNDERRHHHHHRQGFMNSGGQDENLADYSIRRPAVVRRDSVAAFDGSIPKYGVSDLLPAAQHSYGVQYAPLHGHQKDYYQFAESFKKGQFHSGYKRGGHKLQISGHASQHKSHAEGHAKWNGKKGKGVSYWNYQHGDKKPHYENHSHEGIHFY